MKKEIDDLPRYLTTGSVAMLAGVHINTVRNDLQSGDLKYHHKTKGGHFRIDREEARKYAGMDLIAMRCKA